MSDNSTVSQSIMSSISKNFPASFSENFPTLVLLNSDIYPTVSSLSAISSHNTRMYVPLEHTTLKVILISYGSDSFLSKFCCLSIFNNCISVTLIDRGFLTIVSPFLAISYSLVPLTFIAEYIGGICSVVPIKELSVFCIFSADILKSNGFSSITFPSLSPVDVLCPSESSATYSLS